MVTLRALTKTTDILDEKSMEKATIDTVPKKAVDVNTQAYKKRRDFSPSSIILSLKIRLFLSRKSSNTKLFLILIKNH